MIKTAEDCAKWRFILLASPKGEWLGFSEKGSEGILELFKRFTEGPG